MQTTHLVAQKPADYKIDVSRAEVKGYGKAGQDLVVNLVTGDQVVIENFFDKGPNGEVSRLLFE
ncbi:BapA prefix-like domain-containing protein, partial [Cypionkella sp.]|uniref:BapA prefix-like domain-containing protein n=1 Tax=Cypionkella sp. TaxID=2811411 RepID=UPI002ABCF1A7